MGSRAWLAFGALSAVWGSSFLWIKIAVQEVGAFRLVAFRLLFGVIGLLIAGRLTRQPLRLSRKQLPSYLVLALVYTALPFTLISWGETRIESGMTSVLNGTVPLFTLLGSPCCGLGSWGPAWPTCCTSTSSTNGARPAPQS